MIRRLGIQARGAVAEDVVVQRIVIIGNSGSGKTWLAKVIEQRGGLPAVHLDDYHWPPGRYGVPRAEDAAMQEVAAAAEGDRWVMEGVYGWLARVALPRATMLVWLDLPEADCIAGVQARGQQGGGTEEGFLALLDWVAGYRDRTTSSSHQGHLAIHDGFPGAKARLSDRTEVAQFLARYWPGTEGR